MSLVSLVVEQWFDHRLVAAVWEHANAAEVLASLFNPETTAIYRVPLPPGDEVVVTSGERKERFKKTTAGNSFLGERLYMLDSAPMGLFDKPVALMVFRGLATTPFVVFPARAHILINGAPFPFFDPESLHALEVYGEANIPDLRQELPQPPIFASKAALIPPFPGGNVVSPAPDAPYAPPTSTPHTAAPCTPVCLFYGLSFQNPLEDKGNKGRDGIFDDVEKIKDAFGAHNYQPATVICAGATYSTFESLMKKFEDDLAATKFCDCPDDQLVLVIGGHGSQGTNGEPGSITFEAGKDLGTTIKLPDLMNRLAAIPKISNGAKKVYLIMDSCHSGQTFNAGGFPGALTGMHLITSSPDAYLVSYMREFADWIVAALNNDNVKSWSDFVYTVKHNWSHDKNHHGGPPKNGDLGGCRVTVKFVSVRYSGKDQGKRWRFKIEVNGQTTEIPSHDLTPGGTTAEGQQVYDGLDGPCNKDFDLTINTTPYFPEPDGTESPWFMPTYPNVHCPTPAPVLKTCDCPVDRGGADTVLTATYEITARCV